MKGNNKKSGGISGFIIAIVLAGFILAALQSMDIVDLGSYINKASSYSAYLTECIPSGTCDFSIDIGSGGSSGGSSGSTPGQALTNDDINYVGPAGGEPFVLDNVKYPTKDFIDSLETLRIEEANEVNYDRGEWKHWASIPGRSCWTVRKQVLADQAKPGSLKLTDKNKQPTDSIDNACAIGSPDVVDGKTKIISKGSGIWFDPYSGEEMTDASKIDIDHIIPLSYTARHGGQEWSKEKKAEYANDYAGLLATSARENRAKGDKGPSEYMPPYKPYRCSYSKSFVNVAKNYDISITQADKDVLMKSLLTDCK